MAFKNIQKLNTKKLVQHHRQNTNSLVTGGASRIEAAELQQVKYLYSGCKYYQQCLKNYNY